MDDETISVEEIVSYFKECNGQLGKPKLFFIQACRNDDDIDDDSTGVGYKKNLCPPDSSDILVAYSTVEGELSYRDRRKGSWFIQTLIKQITTYAKDAHLMDIMIAVNKDIAESELGGKRQMSQQVCTLTKFVYFKMAKVLEANIEGGISDCTQTKPKFSRSRSIFSNNHDHESDRTVEKSTSRGLFVRDSFGESEPRDAKTRSRSIFSNNHNHESDRTVEQSTSRGLFGSDSFGESEPRDAKTRSRSIFSNNYNHESDRTVEQSTSRGLFGSDSCGESEPRDAKTRSRSIFSNNHNHESDRTVQQSTSRGLFGSCNSGESEPRDTKTRSRSIFSNKHAH